ncbi:MAG: histidine kinase, partial [Nitrospinota bacterium]|nr:histidine kinase [Nitrospinota bacterium]
MRNAFVAMGLILVAVSALLALGLSESIVKPIHALIAATQLLARERFSEPIRLEHGGEIGALAQSFETMRARLAEAMAEVRQYGVELERRVMDRTHELEVQRQRLAVTLDQVIRAQEEERMRIARELHDETSQAILALGMGLEVAAMELRHKELSEEALLESKARANRLLEGIKRIIQDLRPPALDDLGLVSSIRWLLDSHLAQMGIQYIFTPPTAPVILDKGTELRLFRVVQEAVINITRHSGAQNAAISMRQDDGKLIVVISDDGAGFDAETVLMDIEGGREVGFGLLGMRERLAQINGVIRIDSGAGRGTRITITMPVVNGKGSDEKDKDADS